MSALSGANWYRLAAPDSAASPGSLAKRPLRLRSGLLLCGEIPGNDGCRRTVPHFRCAWIRDRVCRQRGRLDLPGSRPRRILADQPAAARGPAGPAAANRCPAVARGDGGGAREERGGHAAGDAARAAGAGLPGRVPRRPGRRQERRRDRRDRGRTRRQVRPRWRRAAHRARRAAPAGRLGREGVGHGAGRRGRRGRSARVPAVHGRGHRVGARRAARHRRGGRPATTGRWSRRWRCSARKRRGNG